MNSTPNNPLDESVRREFGMLLLLDWMMRYDRLHAEKRDLENSLRELEEQVASLKQGFFHSTEEEDALYVAKNDLDEAERARESIVREMEEVKSKRLHLSLSSKDEEHLEPLLREMESRAWIEVGEDDYYITSEKGLDVYSKLAEQQETYVSHFEIFAYVDLETGVFADPETDLLEDNRWSDLRVATAEYRGIDPYRVVFLSLLAENTWFENPDWQFDLGLGILFNNLESLVQNQLSVEELGYEDEQGIVNGEEVIADVIEQGTQLARDRHQGESPDYRNWPGEKLMADTSLD